MIKLFLKLLTDEFFGFKYVRQLLNILDLNNNYTVLNQQEHR